MAVVGIRALKQNASEVVARAAAGESITITDRGRPVAQMAGLGGSTIDRLVADGRARPALRPLSDLPEPTVTADASSVLMRMREDERF